MKNFTYALFLILISQIGFSSTQHHIYTTETSIEGHVTHAETGEPVLFAQVALYKNGVLTTGTETDFDGNYRISNIDGGIYDLEVSYIGYASHRVTDVLVKGGEVKRVNFQLEEGIQLECVQIVEYKKPLIDIDNTSSGSVLTAKDIRNLPTKNINSLAALTAGLSSSDGGSVNARGSRASGTDYSVNGVPVSSHVTKKKYNKNVVDEKPQHKVVDLSNKLTATEVHDFADWSFWSDIHETDFMQSSLIWKTNLQKRYSIQVQNENGFPAPNLKVSLVDENKKTLWSTMSDNLGKAELYAEFITSIEEGKPTFIQVSKNKKVLSESAAQLFDNEVQTIQVKTDCQLAGAIELAFMMDVSGSMDDEIAYLRSEMASIIERITSDYPERTLRVGVVYFQGHGNYNPIASIPLTDDMSAVHKFINKRTGRGGSDEAIDLAMQTMVDDFEWSDDSDKIAFLVGDEELDNVEANRKRQRDYTKRCAEKGIKLVPIGCSGMPKSLEYVMRTMALATGGTYLALTDDSGVGKAHMKPTTTKIDVQSLNQLILDVIVRYTTHTSCEEAELVANDVEVRGPEINLNKKANQTEIEKQVKVFPNPTAGEFKLKNAKKVKEVYLCDLAGRIVKHFENAEDQNQFDISELASGNYFLLYQDDTGAYGSTKIIKVGNEQIDLTLK